MSDVSAAYNADNDPGANEQTHEFGSYNTAMMMYNVPQANTQSSLYDGASFASGTNVAETQFSSSAISQPFFEPVESVSAPNLEGSLSTAVSSAGAFHAGASYPGYGSNLSELQSLQPQTELCAMPEDTEQRKAAELEEKWHDYQRQLGNVFEEITGGHLERAASLLLAVSVWLLSQVTDLGLNEDDSRLHSDRLKLWNDFNHAWLALVYKQKESMVSGQRGTQVQRMLSKDTIQKMGDELIRLCDGIEKHGLVDYQCGVWEDEIETLLEECLDLFDDSENDR